MTTRKSGNCLLTSLFFFPSPSSLDCIRLNPIYHDHILSSILCFIFYIRLTPIYHDHVLSSILSIFSPIIEFIHFIYVHSFQLIPSMLISFYTFYQTFILNQVYPISSTFILFHPIYPIF